MLGGFAAAVVVRPAVAASTAAVAAVVSRIAGRLELDNCAVVEVASAQAAPAMALIRNCGLGAAAGKVVVVKFAADYCCSTLRLDLGQCWRWVSVEVVP